MWGYAPLPECFAASREVVALVGVQLLRALARSATARLADRRDSIHDLFQDLGVVDVGRRVNHRERDTSSVDHNMALRARFALIRRIRSGPLDPRERTRSPSPKTPAPNRSGRLLLSDQEPPVQSLPHTCLVPFFEASPTSHTRAAAHLLGEHLPGDAAFEDEDMPVRAARSSMRGLPPLGLGGSSGSSGSITSQSSSLTSSLVIPSAYPSPGFVRRC
jgi:hypothetical protein